MSEQKTVTDTLREVLNSTRAAFLFIDMQNDFVSPEGKMASFGFEIGEVRDSVQPMRRLLEAARDGGYLVIHTAVINELGQNSAAWTAFWGEPAVTLPGSWGAAHIEELAPAEGEPVIVKYAYGAFVGTNLDTMLRSRGIDTLVVAGTDLNICAGDTLHHAFALGYNVVGAADCLACFSRHDREHARQLKEDGLYLIENHYGLVAYSDQIIRIISAKR
ncbi:MAG: isochorismatase family protein [Spirochaetales bacterium]|nr:isochorismatase family protein [Spirochaetales bacterium]